VGLGGASAFASGFATDLVQFDDSNPKAQTFPVPPHEVGDLLGQKPPTRPADWYKTGIDLIQYEGGHAWDRYKYAEREVKDAETLLVELRDLKKKNDPGDRLVEGDVVADFSASVSALRGTFDRLADGIPDWIARAEFWDIWLGSDITYDIDGNGDLKGYSSADWTENKKTYELEVAAIAKKWPEFKTSYEGVGDNVRKAKEAMRKPVQALVKAELKKAKAETKVREDYTNPDAKDLSRDEKNRKALSKEAKETGAVDGGDLAKARGRVTDDRAKASDDVALARGRKKVEDFLGESMPSQIRSLKSKVGAENKALVDSREWTTFIAHGKSWEKLLRGLEELYVDKRKDPKGFETHVDDVIHKTHDFLTDHHNKFVPMAAAKTAVGDFRDEIDRLKVFWNGEKVVRVLPDMKEALVWNRVVKKLETETTWVAGIRTKLNEDQSMGRKPSMAAQALNLRERALFKLPDTTRADIGGKWFEYGGEMADIEKTYGKKVTSSVKAAMGKQIGLARVLQEYSDWNGRLRRLAVRHQRAPHRLGGAEGPRQEVPGRAGRLPRAGQQGHHRRARPLLQPQEAEGVLGRHRGHPQGHRRHLLGPARDDGRHGDQGHRQVPQQDRPQGGVEADDEADAEGVVDEDRDLQEGPGQGRHGDLAGRERRHRAGHERAREARRRGQQLGRGRDRRQHRGGQHVQQDPRREADDELLREGARAGEQAARPAREEDGAVQRHDEGRLYRDGGLTERGTVSASTSSTRPSRWRISITM